jgi:hypothetical protein
VGFLGDEEKKNGGSTEETKEPAKSTAKNVQTISEDREEDITGC